MDRQADRLTCAKQYTPTSLEGGIKIVIAMHLEINSLAEVNSTALNKMFRLRQYKIMKLLKFKNNSFKKNIPLPSTVSPMIFDEYSLS